MTQRFEAGDAVTLRYITRDGRPGMAWPYVVVRDTDDLVALFIPKGAVYKRWRQGANGRELGDDRWRNDVLRLMFPGRGYSVWLFWDDAHAFSAYYVNMEEPFRRTSIGFDTNDHTLDIVVSPRLEWRWKDADDFAARTAQGIYNAEFAEAVRAEALGVAELAEAGKPPFSEGWESWLPDQSWKCPALHPQWAELPPALWERRLWAYGDARA